MLKDNAGKWLTSDVDIEKEIVNHFSSLFNSTITSSDHAEIESLFPSIISENNNNIITGEVSVMEIKTVMRQLGSLKAPGPDGFQWIFFQKYWSTVGPSIIKLVRDFLSLGMLDHRLNRTFL